MVLVNATRKTTVSDKCHFANTVLKRMVGLLNRGLFEKGEGLLLDRCYGIHTIGMRFPIDVIFCDRYGFVLHVSRLRPGRVSKYVLRAYFAIEAAAGSFDRWEIGLGDVIEVRG